MHRPNLIALGGVDGGDVGPAEDCLHVPPALGREAHRVVVRLALSAAGVQERPGEMVTRRAEGEGGVSMDRGALMRRAAGANERRTDRAVFGVGTLARLPVCSS